jgi:sporulation protein YlmC with PRC-barrel domain
MRRLFHISALALCAAVVLVGRAVAAHNPAPEPTNARVSDLMSLAVYGVNNEKLGKVEDLVVDPASGKIRYAVLSFGGILGMGEKYFAVPWGDLKVTSRGATSAGTQKEVYAQIDLSKDALKNAPGFDKKRWPDFADENFIKDLDHFYGKNRAASRIHGETR